jgi:NOL1/NOP2/fmu family ribosome biogenesis protein
VKDENKMFQILDNTKKKKIIEQVSYLGIEKIPHLLIRIGKERILAYSGSLSRQEISELSSLLSIECIGIYFGKELEDGSFRLSLDMLHLLKNQVNKNIIQLTKEQEEKWFKGDNIELKEEQIEECIRNNIKDFVCIISSDEDKDILGTGKLSQDKKLISNFLPKERRVRN